MADDKAGRLSENYKAASLIDAAAEYFMFCEMGSETPFPEQSDAGSEIELVKECFKRIAENKNDDISDMVGRLDNARKIIIEKMQVLTAYIDRFIVYEYVMNRIEARYIMPEQEIDELITGIDKERFVDDIVNYIFETDEPVEINDRIREIIGQLPVRMSRSKFLSYIKDSVKLYADSDRNSLDGYLYMIRTSAMIYEPEGMKKYFVGFQKVLDELGEADFVTMESDYFNILNDRLKVSTSEIHDIADLYMSLQRMINGLYVYVINFNTVLRDDLNDVFEACIDIIDAVDRAFDEGIEPDSERLFERIEGVMEGLYDERLVLEAMLGKEIPEDNVMYAALKKSEKLMSTSIFAELYETENTEPVTPEYLEEAIGRLLEDLQGMIKKYSRHVVRAVYAILLSSIPVFFANSQELTDYIRHSMEQCGDKVELVACYSLLCDIIMEDFELDDDIK